MLKVGDRIRYQRELRNLSRKELSEKSGVAEVSIAQYELDKRKPRIEQLTKIANALNVDVSFLITEESYPDENYQDWLEKSEPIYKYLDSLGYKIELEQEEFQLGEMIGYKPTGNILLISETLGKIQYSKKDFEEFKLKIKDSIEYLIWQKAQEKK